MRSLRLVSLACVVLCIGACKERQRAAPVERAPVSVSAADAVAVPDLWIGTYGALLAGVVPSPGAALAVPDAAAAAQAVRDGRGRYALTTPSDSAGLALVEFDALPVAFVVPLTFPVEEITAAQARDIVAGRLRDWRGAGGPAGPIAAVLSPAAERSALGRAIGEQPAASTTATAGATAVLPVWLELGTGLALGRKPLRVDGALPGEPAYPFLDRRAIAGRAADARNVETLAAALRRRIAAQRPVEVTLDAVGDIMLGRSVGRLIAERGPSFPLERVQPLLVPADVRFANLELPLTQRGVPALKDYLFRAPPAAVAALTYAGFNLVSLANNHMLDYGTEGLLDTLAALDRAGIAHAGAGRDPGEAHAPAIFSVKGVRLALLAYLNVPHERRSGFSPEGTAAAPGRPGVAWGTPETVRRDVAAARGRADVVIVSLHSGYEYTPIPNPMQRELAYAAVDAGAALVLGSHPHVLQGVEFYRGAAIVYSLGNFVFDLDDDDRRQPGLPSLLSAVLRVTLTADGVRGMRFLPVIIDAREGRPVPVGGAEARPVLERIYRLSDALRDGTAATSSP